jgi:hypothetical protein
MRRAVYRVRTATAAASIRRALSTADEAPARLTAERVRALADGVSASVAAGAAELRRAYGGAHAEKAWASEYYAHGEHRFALPALSLTAAELAARRDAAPLLRAKAVVFYGALLRGLPAGVFAQYATSMALLEGLDLGLQLACVHAAATPASGELFGRLAASLRRRGERAHVELAASIAAVPLTPVAAWAFPHLDPALDAAPPAQWVPPEDAPTLPWE